MRYVVACRLGLRGEGLGNEIVPWAKGFIAGQVLRAQVIGPAWGLNKRKYYRNFRTSRFDFIFENALRALPHYSFTARDYIETGETDYGVAIRKWAAGKGLEKKRSFIVTVDGMDGGYPAIRNARPFILSKLLNSRDALTNSYAIASQLDREKLFVAVHMRGTQGGHAVVGIEDDVRGRFNIVVPGAWYMSVCAALREQFPGKLQFYFFTDRGGPDYDAAVREFNPGQVHQLGLTECSDLILLAQADLRICSISSYSLVASFLSGGPYIWYEPQLNIDNGLYSIWSNEEEQKEQTSPTSRSAEVMKNVTPGSDWEGEFRGYAMKTGDDVPIGLISQLRRRLLSNDRSASILEFGCLPEWTRKKS
jgi:hypothetical protein